MSNDMIIVSRELLTILANGDLLKQPMSDAREQLRALLAQPNTCTKDDGQGEPETFQSWWESLANPWKEEVAKTAAYQAWNHQKSYIAQLIAQIPVVLPERKDPNIATGCYGLEEYGWNAYDDELKRLNPWMKK